MKGKKAFMKIEIYDPAMCCSSGLCGPAICRNGQVRTAGISKTLRKAMA